MVFGRTRSSDAGSGAKFDAFCRSNFVPYFVTFRWHVNNILFHPPPSPPHGWRDGHSSMTILSWKWCYTVTCALWNISGTYQKLKWVMQRFSDIHVSYHSARFWTSDLAKCVYNCLCRHTLRLTLVFSLASEKTSVGSWYDGTLFS